MRACVLPAVRSACFLILSFCPAMSGRPKPLYGHLWGSLVLHLQRLPQGCVGIFLKFMARPHIVGVPACDDAAKWPPERHSRERSPRPLLTKTPFLSCAAKRKGQAVLGGGVLNPRGTRSFEDNVLQGYSVATAPIGMNEN